jgi:copper chaperone CopZ
MKISIFSAVIMTCFSILFAFQAKAQSADTLKTVTLKVSGIDCPRDVKIINTNLKNQKGVTSAENVSKAAATTTFQIRYNPSVVSLDSLYKVVEGSPDCDDPNARPYKIKGKK